MLRVCRMAYVRLEWHLSGEWVLCRVVLCVDCVLFPVLYG